MRLCGQVVAFFLLCGCGDSGAPKLDGTWELDGAFVDSAAAGDGSVTGPDSARPDGGLPDSAQPVDDIGQACTQDSDCQVSCLKISGQGSGLCTRSCQPGGCPSGSECLAHAASDGSVSHVCIKTCQANSDCPAQTGGFGCAGAVGGLPGLCYSGLAGWLDVGGPDDCLDESGQASTTGFIVVRKRFRRLSLCQGQSWQGSWPVGLGQNPVGPKEQQGDSRTPEGLYYVAQKKSSKYYLALLISYPNIEDAKRGLKAGLITQAQHDAIVQAIQAKGTPPQNTALGGVLEIHGCPSGYTVCSDQDWTEGCIAVDNAVMDTLWKECAEGDEIVITP
jgi:hypothetical protein